MPKKAMPLVSKTSGRPSTSRYHAAARGGVFEDHPHLIGKMGNTEIWMCFLRDPERHTIGITEERAGAEGLQR